eukprot:TRINITY_DN5599_c0_g1_i1.p1 TRINITY_DN5599_c0_g1~~TRINITY_DN5599_c0_g1_i1.p1  ORF type:complete len:419 (-),score=128.06 TRINITY_DN5599_c0_g1_i1:80-1336(-)
MFKQVMRTEKLWSRRTDVDANLKKLGMFEQGILMNNNPVTWKHHRGLILKAVNSAAFLDDAVKVLNVLFRDKFDELLGKACAQGEVTDLKVVFKEVFMDLQQRLVFNSGDDEELVEERKHLATHVENFFEAWNFYMQYPPFLLRFFPRFIIDKHDRRIEAFAKYQIKEIQARMKAFQSMTPEEVEKSNDFILTLMKHNREDVLAEELKLEGIRAILNDLYLGLTDTSINTLAGAFFHLSRRPDVQSKLREEITQFFKRHDSISRLNVGELEYLSAFVLECFRYRNTVPFLSREPLTDDVKIGGYLLEKNCAMLLMTHELHTHPDLWNAPKEFNPDRFLGAEGKKSSTLVFPFGGGKRSCPGQALGLLSVKLCIVLMLRSFEFLAPKDAPSELSGNNFIVYSVDPKCCRSSVRKISIQG